MWPLCLHPDHKEFPASHRLKRSLKDLKKSYQEDAGIPGDKAYWVYPGYGVYTNRDTIKKKNFSHLEQITKKITEGIVAQQKKISKFLSSNGFNKMLLFYNANCYKSGSMHKTYR